MGFKRRTDHVLACVLYGRSCVTFLYNLHFVWNQLCINEQTCQCFILILFWTIIMLYSFVLLLVLVELSLLMPCSCAHVQAGYTVVCLTVKINF